VTVTSLFGQTQQQQNVTETSLFGQTQQQPGDNTPQETWDRHVNATSSIATNYKFNVPDLKVGTLDQLVGLSDDLSKIDSAAEQTTRKLVQYFSEVLEEERDKLNENLVVGNKDMHSYVTKFQWEGAKYPLKQSLKVLSEIIGKQITQIDNDLKTKTLAYNNLKNSLASIDRKSTGLRGLWNKVLGEDKAGKNERDKLQQEKAKQYAPLVRWLRINFGEIFSAYVHVKALRVFVESVLRFGLPVNFQSVIMEPTKNAQKRVRSELQKLYQNLDGTAAGPIDTFDDTPALASLGVHDYFPYVFFKMSIDFVDRR